MAGVVQVLFSQSKMLILCTVFLQVGQSKFFIGSWKVSQVSPALDLKPRLFGHV